METSGRKGLKMGEVSRDSHLDKGENSSVLKRGEMFEKREREPRKEEISAAALSRNFEDGEKLHSCSPVYW